MIDLILLWELFSRTALFIAPSKTLLATVVSSNTRDGRLTISLNFDWTPVWVG